MHPLKPGLGTSRALYVPGNTDLELLTCGKQACAPLHSFSGIRTFFLIHYIMEGRGVFQMGTRTYTLRSGQAFLICPGMRTVYTADAQTPWHYCWFAFHGIHAVDYLAQVGLSADSPIAMCGDDRVIPTCVEEMLACRRITTENRFRAMSCLYRIFACLAEYQTVTPTTGAILPPQQLYTREVTDYIERNFAGLVRIQEIADSLGIDRSYLFSLFKAQMGMAPQEYLIRYRMRKASEFLRSTDLSIADIANSVGYTDPTVFTKAFKRLIGKAPTLYRQHGQRQC